MDDKLIEVAMKIILHAGDALTELDKAVDALKVDDSESVKSLMLVVNEEIRLAHLAQTEVIQESIRGDIGTIPLLFIHAQDTLMTAKSEIRMFEYMALLKK